MTDLRASLAMMSIFRPVSEKRNTEPSEGGVDGLELHKRGSDWRGKERGRCDDEDIYLGVCEEVEVEWRLWK